MAVSINLSAVAPPSTRKFTLTDANQANRVQCHRATGALTIQFKANPGQVAYEGTVGTTLGDAEHDQDADAVLTWPVYPLREGGEGADLFLEVATGSTVVVITQHPRQP